MMTFSQRGMLLGNQIPDYLEFAQVCAPNASPQTITTNTITALTLDTEVWDTGNFGSIGSNQFTLQPGTYLFKGFAGFRTSTDDRCCAILSLYNVTDSVYVTRGGQHKSNASGNCYCELDGFFTIQSAKVFELRCLASSVGTIYSDNGNYTTTFSLSTAGTDQRATVKLWRLKETYSQTPIKIGAGNQWTSYAELRNLVAFNAVGQAITADTVATVQLTDESSDVDGIVVLSGNAFTLGAGTYFMELEGTSILTGSTGNYNTMNYWIKNITDNTYAVIPAQGNGIQVASSTQNLNLPTGGNINGSGVIQINGSKVFELQMLCDLGGTLGTVLSSTLSTPSSNCLARVKIYKR